MSSTISGLSPSLGRGRPQGCPRREGGVGRLAGWKVGRFGGWHGYDERD